MEKYSDLHLIKTVTISGKGKLVYISNIFFSALSKSFGIKYLFLMFLSIVIKLPSIIEFKLKKLRFKKHKFNKNQKNILRNLNKFGFSIRDSFLIDEKVLESIISYFYENFNQELINKGNSPMIYGALKKDHIEYILNHLDKNYINLISKYLFNLPYLKTICYMYSKNNEELNQSSQYWHLDKQGPRTLKIFISLHDIDESNGPLTFLDAFKTDYLVKLFKYSKTNKYKRISDESINNEFYDFNYLSEKFLGKKGSVTFLDTDRCLHFGSRKSKNSRLLLYIEYGSLLDYTLTKI